jgi:hypothetical protein
MFRHDCPQQRNQQLCDGAYYPKQTWRDSLPTDMFLSALSVLVVALPSSEFLDRLMNYHVCSWLSVCRLSGLWLTHVPLRSTCNPAEHLLTSLSLSVHMKQYEIHWSDICEIWYWRIL